MPIGQRALSRMGCQFSAQPLLLGRAGTTPPHESALRVQGYQMPTPHVVAVVAARASGARSEIGKVTRAGSRVAGGSKRSAFAPVFVIAEDRTADLLQASPAQRI